MAEPLPSSSPNSGADAHEASRLEQAWDLAMDSFTGIKTATSQQLPDAVAVMIRFMSSG